MQAEFFEVRPFVYNFKLVNMPFTPEELQLEVASYDTTGPSTYSNRYEQANNFGPIFLYLKTFFTSKDFQNQLVSTFSQNPDFYGKHWRNGIIERSKIVSPFFDINIDSPGFAMDIHLDNRELILVGMCHFINADDPDQSTIFYTTETGENPLRIPTGFGCGWVAANLHNTWHSGQNLSNKVRISAHFGISISLPPRPEFWHS
jgi:hypothetical protein